jgi:hypothetical protein
MENRIKECQLDLYADRTSTATLRANQLRLWFASMAYVLLCALRRVGLQHTKFASTTCGTIRLKFLKLGALVRISVRRIKIAMASGCPVAQTRGRSRRPSQWRGKRARFAHLTRGAAPRHHRGIIPRPTEIVSSLLLAARKNPSNPRVFRRHGGVRTRKRPPIAPQN